jgi:hypothetical protein
MRESATHRARLLHLFKVGGFVLLILFGGVLLLLTAKWPFTREATIRSLVKMERPILRSSAGYAAKS